MMPVVCSWTAAMIYPSMATSKVYRSRSFIHFALTTVVGCP